MSDDIDHKTFLKYCYDFAERTKTDAALAHYYLQNNEFNLEKAIANYNSQEHVVIRGFTVPKSERYGLSQLKVLSWNLEGINAKDRLNRTKTVIGVITSCEAHIILLQELVQEIENQLRDGLEKDFQFFIDDSCKDSYYCGILIKKDRSIEVTENSFEIRPFNESPCHRHLLIIKLCVNNIDLKVMTSHLESTRDYASQRKTQLLETFVEMKASDLSIFAGDLNLRDKELQEMGGLPTDIIDVWQYTGSRYESKHTWDPKRNLNANQLCPNAFGQRFDRMYLYSLPNDDTSEDRFTPRFFELQGLEKVPQGIRYPSDHWGILAHFDL